MNKIQNLAFIPNPTFTYEVGARVYPNGSAKVPSVIQESLYDGKLYIIDNKPIEWQNIHTLESRENDSLFPSKRPLHLNYANATIEALLAKVYLFGVDMNPSYQRGYVWSYSDKIAFIESVFMELELGRFIFRDISFNDIDEPCTEIVDGKQRLQAILDFREGRLSYRGRYYRDMNTSDIRRFNNVTVSYCTLHEDITDKEVLEIFLRVNTHGVAMEESHLETVREQLAKLGG